MWKAKINSIERTVDGGKEISMANVEYEYFHDDGRSKIVVERISEPTSINQIAMNAIKELERVDAVADLINNPIIGEIEFTRELTPEEQSQLEEQNKRAKLIGLKNDFDIKLIDQTEYEAKVLTVKTSEIKVAEEITEK